jgi:hypothetical protein
LLLITLVPLSYLEGYHIGTVHPELNKSVVMREYRVHIARKGRWVVHTVPMRDPGSAFQGEWIWLYPSVGATGVCLIRQKRSSHDFISAESLQEQCEH